MLSRSRFPSTLGNQESTVERRSFVGNGGGLSPTILRIPPTRYPSPPAFTIVFAVEDVEPDPLRFSSFFVVFP